MKAIGQFTITNICDVVASETAPENPYVGQLWVDTSASPPETKIWNGAEWVVQNDIETLRTTISMVGYTKRHWKLLGCDAQCLPKILHIGGRLPCRFDYFHQRHLGNVYSSSYQRLLLRAAYQVTENKNRPGQSQCRRHQKRCRPFCILEVFRYLQWNAHQLDHCQYDYYAGYH